jgi:arsenite methyltransferase
MIRNPKAEMFNRKASDPKNKPDEVLKALGLQDSAKENGLINVETVPTEKDKPILPEKSVDLIFMRNVCHHLSNRVEYFRRLKNTLKTSGRVAIIEYRRGRGFSFHKLFGHYIAKEKIIEEMKEAGYKLERDEDFLPEQSFTLFSMFSS